MQTRPLRHRCRDRLAFRPHLASPAHLASQQRLASPESPASPASRNSKPKISYQAPPFSVIVRTSASRPRRPLADAEVIVLGDNGGHRAFVDRELEDVRPGIVADDVEIVFAFCDLGEVEIGSDDRFA